MPQHLSARPSEASHPIQAALEAVYSWNYSSEVDALRSLYAKGLDRQWNAMRDLPWDQGIDRRAFASSFTMGGLPIQETDFWASLSPETQWNVSRKGAAFMLSNFLHGEQGALMVASQLVNAVPHMDGKFYAATQTLDEARHVEVFAAYIDKLDQIYPIAPSLQKLLDSTLRAAAGCASASGCRSWSRGSRSSASATCETPPASRSSSSCSPTWGVTRRGTRLRNQVPVGRGPDARRG